MSAGKYPFIIEQGTTVDFNIVYKDSEGNPIDLKGYDARMHIRQNIDSPSTIMSLSSSLNDDGTGLDMTYSQSGSIRLYISSCASSLLDFHEAIYDLEIASGSDCPYVTRILEGKIRLIKEVTR